MNNRMILAMFLASTLSASAQHRMSIEEMFKLIDKNNTSIQAGKLSMLAYVCQNSELSKSN